MGIKQSVIKQLWGAASNQCAHPDCDEPISDPDQEMVIGEICHIHARNENGPRYDPSLGETEVNSMSNLVLLCPTHHTRIDKDPDNYPAEILQEWREEQISNGDGEGDVSDSILEELINNSGDISIEGGSFVYSENQMGGQTAHKITNIGKQPREIPQPAWQALVRELSKFESPPSTTVTSIMGDSESHQLAKQLHQILTQAGWDVEGVNQAVYSEPVNDIRLVIPSELTEANALGNLLLQLGFDSAGYLDEDHDGMEVIVGSNL